MALVKEIWIPAIIEKLFADNTFASRAANHSTFADGKTIHVPNAGGLPPVTVGNTTYPVAVTERTDTDLNYDMSKYEIGPVRVGNIEEVQLSYDKRNSVLQGVRNAVTEKIHTDILSAWVAGCTTAAQIATVTAFGKSSVLAAKLAFDKKDLPQNGRCLVLTPEAYNALLAELSSAEQFAFSASANAAAGTVGKLFGFDIYMRSVIDTAANNSTAAFAWHEDCVSVAHGNVEIIEDAHRADYFADLISATVLAGGAPIRNDGAGIFKIVVE
ncbi:MAG: hypothetical protein II937_10650 [Bacteroidales bacterium]|nr:hypothetical protein [Bacteroidales bacterium]